MPAPRAAAMLQVALLLSAVPAQYFLSRWMGSTAVQRYHATTRLLRLWKEWRSSYLSGSAWTEWANLQMSRVKVLIGLGEDEPVDHGILDAMLFDNDKGFFGASKTVRSPRPPFVFLRVGEVVMEQKGRMVGVVVSWDSEMQAPPEWISRLFPDSEEPKAENTPHYKVLFSGNGPSSLIVAYLPQTQLKRITGIRPKIPSLENYFTHFNGERFIMRPWLRALFPEDEREDE